MFFPKTHAKPPSRKEIFWRPFARTFAPLRLCVKFFLLFFVASANAQTTNNLSDAEIQGRQFAQEILEQKPAENFTNTGSLKIRKPSGESTEIPITFRITVTPTNWTSIYRIETDNRHDTTTVLWRFNHPMDHFKQSAQTFAQLTTPFGNSDFWAIDLGLEFFHWPQQKILKKETHRSRGCVVLESTNPNPTPPSYSRVVSWIDEETLGIVEAYAYDANGKLLKDFYPKNFKKVRGQWQVQTLLMENVQTRSRSRLEFDLKSN